MRLLLLLMLITSPYSLIFGQNFTGGFNFILPGYDTTTSSFLPLFPAYPIENFVTIDEEGDFFDGQEKIRFWGVNTTTEGNFPAKDQADLIAGRMRKMGINLVRFHHMDNPWSGQDGTLFDRSTGGTRSLHPTTLDRLHYFLAALKANGIYANLNLHVSRTFTEADGVQGAAGIEDFGKAVTFYDPQLIDLQKEFAEQLLTSINPYTGLMVKDDPVVAMVEITNENTLYGWWKGDRLQSQEEGGSLIPRHAQLLDDLWITFLQNKYTTQENLAEAWAVFGENSETEELLRDPGFEQGNISANWQLEMHQGASGSILADASEVHSGSFAGRVQINALTGTDWHLQFKQERISVEQDTPYVITFYAKASQAMNFNIGLMRGEDPWTYYGGTGMELSTDWKPYVFTITPPEDNLAATRLTFNFGATGTVWFDDFSMKKSIAQSFSEGESLSDQKIARSLYSQRSLFSDQRIADLAEFYITLQRNYYRDMYAYLQDQIGVKVPITGTNALVGPADVLSMVDLDYLDDHAYWDHPHFPNTPWDPNDWLISNQSMLTALNNSTIGNVMSGLALQDRPYTISEYNHPYPNQQQIEMIPLMGAYLSFHDVDGIMFFEYHGNPYDEWSNDVVNGYFSINRNHAVMSLMPMYAYAYRERLISTAPSDIIVNYTPEAVFKMHLNDNAGRWGKYIPYSKQSAFSHSIKTGIYDTDATFNPDVVPSETSSRPSTTELSLDGEAGVFIIDAEQIESITGALSQGTSFETSHITVSNANTFGHIGLLSLDKKPINQSEKMILAVATEQQNTGMQWEGNQTVNSQWGQSPTLQKPLQANLTFKLGADSILITALDGLGNKINNTRILTAGSDGLITLELDQTEWNTNWWSIEVLSLSTSNHPVASDLGIRIFPNPSSQYWQLEGLDGTGTDRVELVDLNGKILQQQFTLHEYNRIQIRPNTMLSPGIYLLRGMKSGKTLWHQQVTWTHP